MNRAQSRRSQMKKTTKKKPKKPASTKRKTTSTRRTNADKKKIANKIFDLYGSGDFTLESCCQENGITSRTLHNWTDSISEISASFKKTKEINAKANKEKVRDVAVDGLKRLLTGFFIEEEEVEQFKDKNGALISTKIKKKKKYIQPATAAIIFALKNTDPINWNEDKFAEQEGEEQVFKIGGQMVKF